MKRVSLFGTLALVTLHASCVPHDEASHDAEPNRRGLPAGVVAHADTTPPPRPDIQPGVLQGVTAERVEGFLGPGGEPFEVTLRTANPAATNARRFGTITLKNSMRERSAVVGSYPCTSCHLGRRIVMNDDRLADAHRNINPVHPARVGSTCSTCHSADNVELLTLRSGERATLDHTYRLCAQCHFNQANSWAGGAHGKRLDGWQGRRVVMGCADCHDPHSPSIETRVPFRAPRITRIRE